MGGEEELQGPDTWDKFKKSDKAKEFLLYVVFCFIFSFSAFASKPGEKQFFLTQAAVSSFANCDTGMFCKYDNEAGVYKYLNQVIVNTIFPQFDIQGAPLSELEKLFIQGQARVMGAIRLRQVRSKMKVCDEIPRWLRDVGPYEVLCTTPFETGNKETAPYGDVGQLMNFTQPFTFRTVDELNTTNIALQRGYFGYFYTQDGYALDIIPNLSPRWYAEKVQACMQLMQSSIENCRIQQEVEYDIIFSPPAPPSGDSGRMSPPPPLQLGNEGSAGMVLTDSLSTNFVSSLAHTFLLSANESTAEYAFTLHNPGAITLFWAVDEETLAAVPWIQSIQPSSGFPVTSSPNCTVDAKDCPGQEFVITVVEDDWMRSQVNENPSIARTLEHEVPSYTIVMSSPDSESLRVEVMLSMVYTVAPGATGTKRRRLLQDSSQTCVEKRELKEGRWALDNLLVPSALNLSKCSIIDDIFNECEVEHMGFQALYQESQNDRCGECKCPAEFDPTCLESCSTRNLFKEQLATLERLRWSDIQTRAIILDTTLFFQNDNLFQTVRIYWESFNSLASKGTSPVTPMYSIRTFRLYRYVTGWDFVVMAFEVILITMTIAFTMAEIVQIWRQRINYFKQPWNYVEWANVLIIYVVCILRASTIVIISEFDYDSLSSQYIDFFPIGFVAAQELNVAAVNFFLMYFKLFKYLSNVPRMNAIILTMSNAAFDLLLFSMMFMVVLFGFAAAFYVVFGADLENCKSLQDSFGTLMRILLGDFDYDAFQRSNSTMAPFLFYVFNLVVFFVLLNMFLAIVADAYAEVKGNQSEEDLMYYIGLKDKIVSKLSTLFKRREAVRDMAASLLAGDRNLDEILDVKELEIVFANNPEALRILKMEGAGELMKKYDVNADGVIDKEELTSILKDLAEKQAEIQKEIDAEEAKDDEADHRKDSLEEGGRGHRARRGLGRGTSSRDFDQSNKDQVNVDISHIEGRIDKVDAQIKEMSRNVAKKLSLMIDLMMSLSDQVSSANVGPSERTTTPGDRNRRSNAVMPVLR